MRFAIPLSLVAVLAIGAATGAATAADNTKPVNKACFLPRFAGGFTTSKRGEQLNIRVNRDVYAAEIIGNCPGASFNLGIGLQQDRGSNGFICEGDDGYLLSHDGGGHERCILRNFHKLTADEIAALPKGEKP